MFLSFSIPFTIFHIILTFKLPEQENNIRVKIIFNNLIFCLVTAEKDFDIVAKGQVCEMTKEIADKTEKYNKCKQLLQVSWLPCK